MTPTVSVVIPVYNGGRFLGEALDSIAAQTFKEIEVIVVDDGSSDGSAAIAEARGVTVLRRENSGMSAARNDGIARSRAPFLAFLDHDDLWHPRKLEIQLGLLATHSDAGFALCHMGIRFEGVIPAWFRGPRDGSCVPGYIPSTWLVRRAMFDFVGAFDPALSHGNDTDWLARARDFGVAEVLAPECLVEYRIHGANATGNVDAIHADLKAVLRASLARKRASR